MCLSVRKQLLCFVDIGLTKEREKRWYIYTWHFRVSAMGSTFLSPARVNLAIKWRKENRPISSFLLFNFSPYCYILTARFRSLLCEGFTLTSPSYSRRLLVKLQLVFSVMNNNLSYIQIYHSNVPWLREHGTSKVIFLFVTCLKLSK